MRIEEIRPKLAMAAAKNAYDMDAKFYENS